MGCRITKEEDDNQNKSSDINTVPTTMSEVVDYKSRLEWKLCYAKDTPEPDFDLSDCMLKDIPSGIFVLCRVLRKERLKLNQNQLRSLNGGGLLSDLTNLRELDLSNNKLTRLPDELYKLENLRELFLSNNQIETLPNTINRLPNLEHLDVSGNKILQINQVNCMSKLRILNVSGNRNLRMLPTELTTCDSLIDIIIDAENITYPPSAIIELGTVEILRYLLAPNDTFVVPENVMNISNKRLTEDFIHAEKGEEVFAINATAYEKYSNEKRFKEHECLEYERYKNLEALLHQQNQKRKEEFLVHLKQQQNESDTLVERLQKERDSERIKIIKTILTAEENAGMIVNQLLSLKSGPDPNLLEQEQIERELLLQHLHINHDDLRKRDILTAMTELIQEETKQIQCYNDQRDANSRNVLEQEITTNLLLEDFVKNNHRDRLDTVTKITQDEELQKVAVGALIAKNDARMWGLIEQVRIVEAQLAAMSQCEIERKMLQVDNRLIDISEQRLNLTYVLMDLLNQQEKRKQELLDTLLCMELQKENEQQDFWLLQYQKLLDSQPDDVSFKSTSIDPLLGYNFLVNGVVHCIPFLSKMWQSTKCDIADLTDTDLIEAGIKKSDDRAKILQSIKDFLQQQRKQVCVEEAAASQSQRNQPSSPDKETEKTDEPMESEPIADLASECIICMEEECKIIFLPCGHLCCCLNCHNSIENCPICRATIDRRIKVIPV